MKISDGRKTLATRADLKRLGINVSNTTLLRWEARGRFPRRIRMAGTSVAWFLSEIEDWLNAPLSAPPGNMLMRADHDETYCIWLLL